MASQAKRRSVRGSNGHRASSHRLSTSRGVLRGSIGLFAVAVIAGVAAVWLLAWPRVTVQSASDALAQISHLGGGHLLSAEATYGTHTVRLVAGEGGLVPISRVPQGTRMTVTVEVREPSWLAWLIGGTRRVTDQMVTPSASLVDPIVVARPGQPVKARFSRPVRVVVARAAAQHSVDHVQQPSTQVDVISSVRAGQAGIVQIAAAPQTWESLHAPVSLSYFGAAGSSTMLLTQPNLQGGTIDPSGTIRMTFSRPVASVFGTQVPTITPVINGALAPKGHWTEPTANSLLFTPSGATFWPGEQYRLALPAPVKLTATAPTPTLSSLSTTTTKVLQFSGAPGSIIRLQQLLASLGYLPLSWSPTATTGTPVTVTSQIALMATSPTGTFTWRWAMPVPLTSLWQLGTDNVITQGAIMTFEQVSHLDTIGVSNPLLWPTLINAAVHHTTDPHPYTWIEVTKALPETLTFYRNGAVALTNLVNTGIAGARTASGTYPVYLRLAYQTMRGHNPNGTAYADPVHWINYFNGSDAVHGFYRPAGYGFPQSVGCVELPIPVAATLWPMVHIGTLVTVLP